MRHKPVVRELAVVALFVALAVGMTWPLAANLSTAVNDLGDPLLNAWILDWVCHALIHQPLQLYDAPIFHPAILPLAYSENLVAVAILVLPLHLAGASPITLHNVAFLLGFALSGYGAFVLARMVSRSTIGALVGGIFFAFCSYKFEHPAHLQIIFSAWVPLLLAALLAFWEQPTWRRGALLTLAWVANGLTNVYFLMFAGVATLFTVAILAVIRQRGWRFYAKLAVSTLLAVIILLPFLLPYRTVSKHYHLVRNFEEVRNGSATWINWLVPGHANRMYGSVPVESVRAEERNLFPGLLILFLAAAGWLLWRGDSRTTHPGPSTDARDDRRLLVLLDALILALLALAWATIVSDRVEINVFGVRLLSADGSEVPLMAAVVLMWIRFAIRLPRALGGVSLRDVAARSRFNAGAWAAAVWIVVGVAGSFGASNFIYVFFYRRFEPFQAMRVPARFAIIAYVGLAVWGALGAAALVNARHGRKRIVAAALLLLLMIAEVRPNLLWLRAPEDVPPVYTWLAKTRVGPVLELPFTGDGAEYLYLLGSTEHRVPIVNGTSGFYPSEYWKMRDPDSRDDFDAMLGLAETWGTRLIVVHAPLLAPERRAKVSEFLKRNLATHRLELVRTFDNEAEGDWVFAVTRNFPQWKRVAAPPDVPDGAGFLPQQALGRFLTSQPTHSSAIVIRMETPHEWFTAEGPLRIRGWTLSPFGVRRVTAHFEFDERSYEMQRVPRPDVQTAYPWQRYTNQLPGFELVLDERPQGIRDVTSVQVEVEDLAGRKRRGPYIRVRWQD